MSHRSVSASRLWVEAEGRPRSGLGVDMRLPALSPALDDFAIACRDQPVHLLRRQTSRQVGKPPAGIARNDIGAICSAAAFDSKLPQECAQAGRQLFDGSFAATSRAVQEK